MKTRSLLLTIVLFALSAVSIRADIIWDQTPPDNLAFGHSDFNPSLNPPVPGHYGDSFTLTTTQTIATIEWFGIYYPGNTPPPDDFSIRFHTFGNDNPGEPDIVQFATYAVGNAVNRMDTGMDPYGIVDLYSYSVTLTTPLTLGPGEYLLSIINDTTGDVDDTWWWSTYIADPSEPPPTSYYRTAEGLVWDWNDGELAFRLLSPENGNGSAVPEGGATALMMGVGLAGIAFVRRRFKPAI